MVERFWVGRWNLDPEVPHVTEMVSDPSVHLVSEHSPTFPDGHPLATRVVGVWTRLWVRELRGEGRVVGMKLRPGAVRAFLDLEAHETSNRLTPFQGLPALGHLDDDAAVAALAEWAVDHRLEDDGVAVAVRLCERLRTSDVDRVEAFAVEVGRSVRTLQRLFKRHVGASPKQLLRRFRLQRVSAEVDAGALVSAADLALSLGYVDQAHLARDLRAATGKTLTEVLRARTDQTVTPARRSRS